MLTAEEIIARVVECHSGSSLDQARDIIAALKRAAEIRAAKREHDERLPDWHGPSASTPEYHHHKRAYDTATDLLNGRITNPGARRELRKALDVADKEAPKVDHMPGRALKFSQ